MGRKNIRWGWASVLNHEAKILLFQNSSGVHNPNQEVQEHGLNNTAGRKVIFVLGYPMGARDAKRFGLRTLQHAGLQVEGWDLSHFFLPALPAASQLGIERPTWVDLTVCSSIEHFRDLCSTLASQDVVISIGGLHPSVVWRGRKIFRMLSATPARLTSVSLGHIPPPIVCKTQRSFFGSGFARVFLLLVNPHRWKIVPQLLAPRLFGRAVAFQRRMRIRDNNRPLHHIWAGTRVEGKASFFISPSTTVTYIHTLDYDLALAARGSNRTLTPQVVFIDSMGPLHPDFFLLGASRISIEDYSEIVCRGLDQIEKKLGTEVVIAAHPRANEGVMEPWYGGRTIVYGKTTELIANATAVIASNGSTVIGMAAVFQRPLVLVSSSNFESFDQGMTRAVSQELSTPIIDLDAPELPTISLDVNVDAYNQYIQKYVKRSRTPEEPFWSVVASEILSGAESPDKNMVD